MPSPAEHNIVSSQHNEDDFSESGTPTSRPILNSRAQHEAASVQQPHEVAPNEQPPDQADLSDTSLPPLPFSQRTRHDIIPDQQSHDFPRPAQESTRSTRPTAVPEVPPITPNSAPPGQFDMLPPPASMHASWQALHDFAQSYASEHGYAMSINTTAKNRLRIKLACVCYGKPKNTHKLTPETRVRKNRQSGKTDCKMWIEGKKMEDGFWRLRVGNPAHNHAGKAMEDWAVQRKRTWGVVGTRVGVGGVAAKEEQARLRGTEAEEATNAEQGAQDDNEQASTRRPSGHNPANDLRNLEKGGLVWRIVEQELLVPSRPTEGRDRGVGRTVKILQERLPGIHIFKRDVYNIRSQIKRARKAAGQPLGAGLDSDDDENADEAQAHQNQIRTDKASSAQSTGARLDNSNGDINHSSNNDFSQIDPGLIAQCNSALRNIPPEQESEVERLRRENAELREALAQRSKELHVKHAENEGLRVQVQLVNMALYDQRGGSAS
jgi:hypothetical protein